MNKIMKRTGVLSLVFCMLVALSADVYAQTSGTTEAEVEFIAGTGPTLPVNPENPTDEIEGGTPVTGSLAIVSVSDFNFGSITVTGAAGRFNITTAQPNIQVVDLRGTGTGWSVNASVSGFTSAGAASLPGAVIHIYNGRPNSQVSSSYAPTQVTNVALTTDNTSTRVITAAAGTGTGLWVMRWYPPVEDTGAAAYVQLEIPAGVATVGTHTATITWTLSNTP